MNKEKILKLNKKQFIPTLIFFSFNVIFLIMAFCFESIFLIASFVTSVWLLFFLAINVINVITACNSLRRYNINEVKEELNSKDVIKLEGVNTYLTKNYIISNDTSVRIVKYSDIVWIYYTNINDDIKSNASLNLGVSRYAIEAYLKNGKRVTIINRVKNYHFIKNILENKIRQKNKEALIGYNIENVQRYKQINRKYSLLSNIYDFSFNAFILIIIIIFIYFMFF